MNVLVIAPHPDDESIGCGGTICLHSAQGDRVAVTFLTSGEFGLNHLSREEAWKVRECEAEKAARILDIRSVRFLRCPDHRLGDGVEHASKALRPILESEQPQLIYLTYPSDWHPDHRAALPIVQKAIQDSGIPAPRLLSYEVLTPLTEYDKAEDIGPFMQRKLNAVRCHRSQVRQLRYDRAMRALNEYRGVITEAGRYVEVFQVVDDSIEPALKARRKDPMWHRVYRLAQEIVSVVPTDATFVLVDDDQLALAPVVSPRRCIPFLEKDGQYWGPPADDQSAIHELDRMWLGGAHFMVFAWPSFWWFDHYSSLTRHLRSRFHCLLENERLVIFDLRNEREK
jgi:LmbE family N-acetylglucosaminyl deacetylase